MSFNIIVYVIYQLIYLFQLIFLFYFYFLDMKN